MVTECVSRNACDCRKFHSVATSATRSWGFDSFRRDHLTKNIEVNRARESSSLKRSHDARHTSKRLDPYVWHLGKTRSILNATLV